MEAEKKTSMAPFINSNLDSILRIASSFLRNFWGRANHWCFLSEQAGRIKFAHINKCRKSNKSEGFFLFRQLGEGAKGCFFFFFLFLSYLVVLGGLRKERFWGTQIIFPPKEGRFFFEIYYQKLFLQRRGGNMTMSSGGCLRTMYRECHKVSICFHDYKFGMCKSL